MAKHWLNNGCDDIGAYLEIQTIDLLIDIWKGEPNQNKWHQIRSLAEDRKKFQDPVDKFRIAFFDYLLGYLQSSKNKLIDIHPSLGNSNLTITRDNFRLSVYYAEILKRQGDFKKASSINKKIRSYLQMSDEFANRGNDLGISDVEFYALNGDKDKAIERLHLAVNHQGWLPNSYWLWLPLNKNPFLKSLSQRQDFQSLNTDITQQLDELCFDRNCNFSARPDSKLI